MRRIAAAATLAAFFLPTGVAHAATERLWVDTNKKVKSKNFVGTVKSRQDLTAGKPYLVKVRGTFAFYDVKPNQLGCGRSERRPIYRSPRARNGRVVADAEFIFAERRSVCRARNGEVPFPGVSFQMATGKKYRESRPIGNPTAPTKSHAYRYALVGEGRKVAFRLKDQGTVDNYGRLRVVVSAARPSNCDDNGFALFGFASEADCVTATALRG